MLVIWIKQTAFSFWSPHLKKVIITIQYFIPRVCFRIAKVDFSLKTRLLYQALTPLFWSLIKCDFDRKRWYKGSTNPSLPPRPHAHRKSIFVLSKLPYSIQYYSLFWSIKVEILIPKGAKNSQTALPPFPLRSIFFSKWDWNIEHKVDFFSRRDYNIEHFFMSMFSQDARIISRMFSTFLADNQVSSPTRHFIFFSKRDYNIDHSTSFSTLPFLADNQLSFCTHDPSLPSHPRKLILSEDAPITPPSPRKSILSHDAPITASMF